MNRRRLVVRLLCAVCLAAGAAERARASFELTPAGARSAAMAGASLAGLGDSSSLFLNPAAIARLERAEAYFMYNRFYAGLEGVGGLNQGFVSAGVPFKGGAFALGYGDLLASGLLEERTVGLAYARRFGAVEAGLAGKYLHHRFIIDSDPLASGDPVFSQGSGRGAFAFDAGVAAPLGPSLTAGLAVRNLNRPDVGLESRDRVAREIQGGLSWDAGRWGLRLTADYLYRDDAADVLADRNIPGAGLEKALEGGRARFRLGVTPDQLSGGAGVQFDHLGFDYAFVLSRHLLANNLGTHILGVRIRFGVPR